MSEKFQFSQYQNSSIFSKFLREYPDFLYNISLKFPLIFVKVGFCVEEYIQIIQLTNRA